jgi:plasmid stabilization system protein ParE
VRALDEIIVTHALPSDTVRRVLDVIELLAVFPMLGRAVVSERLGEVRFVLGPWRWMTIVYEFDAPREIVRILTVEDARTSDAATNYRA